MFSYEGLESVLNCLHNEPNDVHIVHSNTCQRGCASNVVRVMDAAREIRFSGTRRLETSRAIKTIGLFDRNNYVRGASQQDKIHGDHLARGFVS
jgi:hypothetical protein